MLTQTHVITITANNLELYLMSICRLMMKFPTLMLVSRGHEEFIIPVGRLEAE